MKAILAVRTLAWTEDIGRGKVGKFRTLPSPEMFRNVLTFSGNSNDWNRNSIGSSRSDKATALKEKLASHYHHYVRPSGF